ncbi:GNAT family N-acetyltransferase [Candidatus Leptofilum sp.]|uniref:GNAT family N-acetyltransferase n=1 Tax=Candidatus Leptofilum sp. TaxID=3241576 RepID=UPI003B58EC28
MYKNLDYASIEMQCPDLNKTPIHHLPTKYSIRDFQPGDERVWLAIQKLADKYNVITEALFYQEFGNQIQIIKQRQLYLLNPSKQTIGTSTAWFTMSGSRPNWGRVHWVAIVPSEQGKGLAKPLLSFTCRRLCDLGHSKAYLTTANNRIAAINLYLKFGFQPIITTKDQLEIWTSLESKLREPIPWEGINFPE